MKPNEAADAIESAKRLEDGMTQAKRQLWKMDIFDTIPTSDGHPMVTRVPGGWIWYLFAEKGLGVTSTFVPLTSEGHPDGAN